MIRHAVAAVVTLAVGIGLVDPYACVQYSSGGSLTSGASTMRTMPQADHDRLLDAARHALELLPTPRRYTLDSESIASVGSESAPWNETRKRWSAPGAARAERSYEPPGSDAGNAPPVLEQHVFVNSEVDLPSGLASEGGTPHAFPLKGAAAVLVTTIGATPEESGSSAGGRVALPVSPNEAASSVTILRVLIADTAAERAFRAAATSGALRLPAAKPPSRPGVVRSLVVELYGGRQDVEELARRIPVESLRKLLDPV